MKKALDRLNISYEEPYPGALVVHDFADKYLHMDPAALLSRLNGSVPTRAAGDAIVPDELQWVLGENENLRYRGHVLPRRKIWLQDGPIRFHTNIYSYTGFTYLVAQATSDWNDDEELAAVCRKYNSFIGKTGAPAANHAIITAYDDGKCSIGMHHDKMRSLDPNTFISVLKLGENARPFSIRRRVTNFPEGANQAARNKLQEAQPMLFNKEVAPGDLILMTAEANLATQHGVPELRTADAVGLSGSLVWRTTVQQLSPQQLAKRVATTEAGRAKRRAEKLCKTSVKKLKVCAAAAAAYSSDDDGDQDESSYKMAILGSIMKEYVSLGFPALIVNLGVAGHMIDYDDGEAIDQENAIVIAANAEVAVIPGLLERAWSKPYVRDCLQSGRSYYFEGITKTQNADKKLTFSVSWGS
jgi:alkylated DNA repair dioxygenase AlkB